MVNYILVNLTIVFIEFFIAMSVWLVGTRLVMMTLIPTEVRYILSLWLLFIGVYLACALGESIKKTVERISFKIRVHLLRRRFQRRFKREQREFVPAPPVIIDDVYIEGMKWLDSQNGPSFEELSGMTFVVKFEKEEEENVTN